VDDYSKEPYIYHLIQTKARIEALASHEYGIWKNRRGPVGKESRPRKGRLYPDHFADRLLDEDLTKLTPEEYRSLTAPPK